MVNFLNNFIQANLRPFLLFGEGGAATKQICAEEQKVMVG
jgi:hypothetical protein